MGKLSIDTISKRSVHGVLALVSRNSVLQLINLGSFVIISSILQAKDLGIYTAVIAIQRVISFLTDFGLGAALVQKKEELRKEDLMTTFTIQAGITLFIFVAVFSFLNPISSFFKLNQSGQRLLLVLVFTIFISSFKTIPSIILERGINFSKLVVPQIAESLIFNVVLVVLVIQQFGVDSYSWAFLISSLIGIPFYYYVSPWKPSLGVEKGAFKSLKYGIQFQAKNILATIKDDLLTVILVKFISFSQIGYIGFAQRISFFVFRYIVDSVSKVTFSTYARIQESQEHLRIAIEKSLFLISVFIFPIITGLMVTSPFIITYFPGWQNKWEPAIISIVFFCLNAIISSMSSILVNVLDATGRVKTTLKLMVIWTILTWVLTPILIQAFGYNGVAMASFAVTLTIFITIYLVKQVVKFSFIKSIYKPALSTGAMIISVVVLSQLLVKDLASLILVIILGGAIYTAILFSLAGNEIKADFRKIYSRT